MTTFIVTNKATGQEVYRYDAAQLIEWNGMEFATHDHAAMIESIADVIPRMASARRLTKLAFIGRIGDAFRGILAAAKVNVDVEMFVKMLDWATPDADGTSVDLDDVRVITALTQLEAAGLIPAGKALEILA